MNHYNLLLAHIPKISQWFQHLGRLLHRYGDHPYYQNTFEAAKQHILYHLRSSVTILVGATGVRSVLRVVSANKRRKRGPKSAEDKRAYDEMVQMMLIGLFQDKECQPLRSYLAAHDMEFLRKTLRNVIDSNERLKYIMLRERRKNPRLVKEALNIIRGLKYNSNSNKKSHNNDSDKENQNNNCESVHDRIDIEQERTIFDSSI